MKKYIVNPAYKMRMDGNRVLIASKGLLDEEKYDYESCVSFVHPITAQMLSFFTGKDELDVIINNIADYFHLSIDCAYKLVSAYVENDEQIKICTKYGVQHLPKKIIIPKDKFQTYPIYDAKEFLYHGIPDLRQLRCNIPSSCMLELTMNCYTDCIYCYANRRMTLGSYLSLEKIISIIKEAKEYGIIDFGINGGEVLLHPHYKEILLECLKQGYHPYVSTKVPLSQKVVNDLSEIGLERIQISLDSTNPNILRNMINAKENYIQLMSETFERLEKVGIKVIVHTIVTSMNSDIKEFEHLVGFVSNYSVVRTVRFTGVGSSLYKTSENYNFIKPTNDFMGELENWIQSAKIAHPNITFSCSGGMDKTFFRSRDSFNGRSLCSANLNSLVILPDGKVTICEELYDDHRFIIGDLKKQAMSEIWNSEKAISLFYIQKEKFPDDSPCKTCESFESCRYGRGSCWKFVFEAYGKDKFYYPDPRCPKAPEPMYEIYYK